MARSYGQIMSAIWNDPDFRALTSAAQRAYLMLVTQADISSAGTLPLTLKRWSGYAIDTPSDALSDALSELSAARFILFSEATEEVLVRKFVKHDGGHNNEKRRPAIIAAANAALAPEIRAALAAELDTLGVPHALSDGLSDRASHTPSDTPRVVVTEGESIPEPEPQPATLVPAAERRTAPKRGTRLPDDWRPTDTTRAWTLQQTDPTSAALELEKFRNHWLSKTGRDATKLDWDRTWRNWILNARQRARPTPQQATDDHFARAAARMGVTP